MALLWPVPVRLWEGETLSSSPSAPRIGGIFVRCERACPPSLLEVARSVVCRLSCPQPVPPPRPAPSHKNSCRSSPRGILSRFPGAGAGWGGGGSWLRRLPQLLNFLSFLKPESHPGSQQSLKSGSLFRNELSSPCLAP